MAITIHFLTVVIRIDSIEKKYPGGLNAFMKCYTSWRDSNLIGIGFMSNGEAEEFIDKLTNIGFNYIVNDEYVDIAIVDMIRGLFLPCKWLETSIINLNNKSVKVSTCWLKESTDKDIGVRLSKDYEPSPWFHA